VNHKTFLLYLWVLLTLGDSWSHLPCARFSNEEELTPQQAREVYDSKIKPAITKLFSQTPAIDEGILITKRRVEFFENNKKLKELIFETVLNKSDRYAWGTQKRTPGTESIFLVNPSYDLNVSKLPSGVFTVLSADQPSQPWLFLQPNAREDWGIPQTGLFSPPFTLVSSRRLSDRYQFTFRCDPDAPANPTKLVELVADYDAQAFLPIRIDCVWGLPSKYDQAERRSIVDLKWGEIQEFGMRIPIEKSVSSFTGRDILLSKEIWEVTARRLEGKFDKARCFAEYYGLPAPFARRNLAWTWAGAFFALGFILLIAYKLSSKRGS
jgi:hypothetical protein